MFTDIWVVDDGLPVAIELKYLTGNHHVDARGEPFDLRAAAGDFARYDSVKDVCRLEAVAAGTGAVGLAIVLSSVRAFWAPPRLDTYDREFRLHEGRSLEGIMAWGSTAPPSAKRGRETPLTLSGAYPIQWRDYASLSEGRLRFRYMCVEVKP